MLPANVLVADRDNNRLLELTPQGRIVWRFPRPGDLRPHQRFRVPDDAFYAPRGRRVLATEEDDFAITLIDMATHRIVYRYGRPGVPGAGPNRLNNPDDAILGRDGTIFSADIKNCRLIRLRPPSHVVASQLGSPGFCAHLPPQAFGSPNGAFPTRAGGVVVTEITGNWIDVLDRRDRLVAAFHAPGFTYPSDTNEVRPGLYLSVDYTKPGAIETFDGTGRLRWRFAPTGKQALNRPSVALPLPNGDILASDDLNHRIIVVDPRRNRIVWQYGHRGHPGRGPGHLANPDGVELAGGYGVAARTRR